MGITSEVQVPRPCLQQLPFSRNHQANAVAYATCHFSSSHTQRGTGRHNRLHNRHPRYPLSPVPASSRRVEQAADGVDCFLPERFIEAGSGSGGRRENGEGKRAGSRPVLRHGRLLLYLGPGVFPLALKSGPSARDRHVTGNTGNAGDTGNTAGPVVGKGGTAAGQRRLGLGLP